MTEASAEEPRLTSFWNRRIRNRRLAILGTAAILLAGGKMAPGIERQIRLSLAERTIADNRLDEAAEQLDRMIEREPTQTWPRLLRARVARLQGEITEAEEILQRAIELGLPVEQARAEHELIRMAEGFPTSTVRRQ